MEPLRFVGVPSFANVIFRRTTKQARNVGGLWDESRMLYAPFGARPLSNDLKHAFPSGAVVQIAHLEHEKDVFSWDGAQIPLISFDQLESFTAFQFWYLLSRNRDPSGRIRPYVRATCNPLPDHWLGDLLAWWIDQEKTLPDGSPNPGYGYAIRARSGVLRWFIREGETILWGDSREELLERYGRKDLPEDHPEQPRPLSITFIPGLIYENVIGLERDPLYLAKMKGLQRVERERLLGDAKLGGNWKVKASAGMLFRREWCTPLQAEPADVDWVRGWDLAATRPSEANADPDWTVGVKLGRYRSNRRRFVIAAAVRMRESPSKVETALRNTAIADGPKTRIRLKQDPGQAGKSQAASLVGSLSGFSVKVTTESGDKVTKFSPFSAQAEAGNVDYVLGAVPEEYLRALEGFPDAPHDDDVDATSTAFEEYAAPTGGANLIEAYRREKAERDAKVQEAKEKRAKSPEPAEPANPETVDAKAREKARQKEIEAERAAIERAAIEAIERVGEALAQNPNLKPSSFVDALAAKIIEEKA